MRLRKKLIDHIAKTVADSLVEKDLLALDVALEIVTAEISRLITTDLAVEDRLNEEVKAILRAHTQEIDRGNIDYARMFAMVKKQLVKERGLIL
jgi:hypothetical protein